jgi:tRNA (uracil-5-)-methyltransferase
MCRAQLLLASELEEVHVIGRCKGQRLLLDQGYVIERFDIEGRTLTHKQPEGTFSQPNGTMCAHMVSWATRQVRNSPGDCLELYCGNGNFTLSLARHFRQVVATEVRSKSASCALGSMQGFHCRAFSQ